MARTRIPEPVVESALRQLRRDDPIMRAAIKSVGSFTLRLQPNRFRSLVRAILAQQISTSAARSIMQKFETALGDGGVTPEAVATLEDPTIRAAGVSPQKIGYLRSLTEHVLDGTVNLRQIGRKKDADVIASLTRIRGIGVWTAQMFLIFTLGRPDVLPVDDLGIRSNIRTLYGLGELPTRSECEEVAAPWRPYASIASWYLWRSGDVA